MEYGCLPYIMRFEKYHESKYKSLYIQLARWCNQPRFFKKKSFRQYCEANEEYHLRNHPNSKKSCSCFQAMIDFEKEHPEIAEKYFDLRYEELNKCHNLKVENPTTTIKSYSKISTRLLGI
jgi:hypothetical protein